MTKIGTVMNYFEKVGVAAIKLSAPLKVGDKIKISGGKNEFEQEVDSIQIHHEKVEEAKAGDKVGIKVKEKVRRGYKLERAN